jgi:hypothetical protein
VLFLADSFLAPTTCIKSNMLETLR